MGHGGAVPGVSANFRMFLYTGYTLITLSNFWENSGSLRLGGEYHVNPSLDVRAGFSFNSSPIPNDSLMSAVPDSKHWDIHMGVGYRINKWKIEIGYVHKFYTERANPHWYGIILEKSQGSLFAISFGMEI